MTSARLFSVGQSERSWLKQFAARVSTRLAEDARLTSFRATKSMKVQRAPFSDGWYSDIGALDIPGTQGLAAFVDTMTRSGSPRLWTGFFVSGDPRAVRMGQHLKRHVATVVIMPETRFVTEKGHLYFKSPLPKTKFGVPMLERFTGSFKDIGIYWPDTIDWTRLPAKTIVDKSVQFFGEVIAALDTFAPKPPAIFVHKKRVVSTSVYTRSSAQAKEAFTRDNWTCRICDLAPTMLYGIEGRRCLEAHHVNALHAQIGRVESRMGEVVTVCANCHRVLGGLSPDKRGFKELRRRFAR